MVYQCGDWTMEESSPQNLNGEIGSAGGVNKQNENNNQRPQYSIPGILHFIQHEWAKFEMERSQWEVHRAELEVIINFFNAYPLALIMRLFINTNLWFILLNFNVYSYNNYLRCR